MITFIILYITGYLISYTMLRIEHAGDKEPYTKGDRALTFILSLLSFLLVLWMLITAWVRAIGATGYWNEPVKKEIEDEEVIEEKPKRTKTK